MFITHNHRRQQMRRVLLIFCGLFLLSVFGYSMFSSSSVSISETPEDPRNVVEQFYNYERSGDFGSAWELFHPLMKDKFNKQDYIQTRSRVFMQNFGVETFEVKIGDYLLETSWKMSPMSPVLSDVHKYSITLVYRSYFGDLNIVQDVYVAKDDGGQYRVLWPYSQ